MDLSQLKVGYAPQSPDFSHPGDRRRFCLYADRRGIPFETADPEEEYDVVVLSQGADLSRWVRYEGDARLVFDFVDSYLAVPESDLKSMLRGVAKFAFRQTRHLHLSYRALQQAICRRADAVVCTTEEQRRDILNFCPNVHVILDVQSGAVRKVKADYAAGEPFNLVWEGLPGNLITFDVIREALAVVSRRHAIALHLVTDLEWSPWLRTVGRRPTKDLVRRSFDLDRVYLYEWNEALFASVCTACDLALIPIPLGQPIYAGKPENKLLLFWRMGLPTVTSATPAYRRAMGGAGLSMACRTTDEWVDVLDRCITDEAARRDAAASGRAYAESAFGEERLLARWDEVFSSILEEGKTAASREATRAV